ncbi:Rz1-like lysis system protein LysC [Pseudomonas sp. 5P_3.1_Bac2]|uniref:Rz1-like lysis system protein LysC n=1 Tax=Pseudomonas sp. 5P_3.1_Bac2 TaxID=2971617 RepID=UPI003965BCBA
MLLSACVSAPPSVAPRLMQSGYPPVIPCQLPSSQPRTNGELLSSLDALELAWAECAAQVDQLYQLQQQEAPR